MTIITGQTNSFSRWVHPTNAVFIVGNVNIRVQRSDPNFRPATSDTLNKGTSNGLSYVEILLRLVKFVSWQMRQRLCIKNYLKNKSSEFHSF